MKSSLPNEFSGDSQHENLKKLSAGSVLLARDVLTDPNFDIAVVLLCLYGDDGAYGLILNRTSHMPLSEIFDGYNDLTVSREVYIGGPVQPDELQILQITDQPVEGSYQIANRVYLGGKWDAISQMITRDSRETRLFLGYSGWSQGQLEGEIQKGAWDVYNVDIEQLLNALPLNGISNFEELETLLINLSTKL